MPRTSKTALDNEILAAALAGLELQRRRIEEQIAQVRAALGRRRGRPPGQAVVTKAAGKSRLSAAAKKRIAKAQKRRWAEHRKRQKATAKGEK